MKLLHRMFEIIITATVELNLTDFSDFSHFSRLNYWAITRGNSMFKIIISYQIFIVKPFYSEALAALLLEKTRAKPKTIQNL